MYSIKRKRDHDFYEGNMLIIKTLTKNILQKIQIHQQKYAEKQNMIKEHQEKYFSIKNSEIQNTLHQQRAAGIQKITIKPMAFGSFEKKYLFKKQKEIQFTENLKYR